MRRTTTILIFAIIAMLLCGCQNLPQDPTKTPTMSPEELMAAAQETAAAVNGSLFFPRIPISQLRPRLSLPL